MPAALLFVFSTEKRDGRVVLCFWPCGTRHPSRAAKPDAWRMEMGGRPPLSPVELIVLYNGGGRRSHAKCCFQQITMDEGIVPSRPAACGGARSVGACSKGGRSYKNLPALSP